MVTTTSILGSVLIPVHKKSLLLPNVSMAELIAFKKPTPAEQSPAWHLGFLTWRGTSIPIISFEMLNGEEINPDFTDARIAVFNSVGTNSKLPFYGVLTQGIPRSVKISAADIIKEDKKVGPAELACVSIKNESATIPSVDFIENAIVKANIV